MQCRNPDACSCLCHKSPDTHVPTCPRHGQPLSPSVNEPGKGYCRECRARDLHAHLPPQTWVWIDREVFSGWDLPPWNGFVAVETDEDGWPV